MGAGRLLGVDQRGHPFAQDVEGDEADRGGLRQVVPERDALAEGVRIAGMERKAFRQRLGGVVLDDRIRPDGERLLGGERRACIGRVDGLYAPVVGTRRKAIEPPRGAGAGVAGCGQQAPPGGRVRLRGDDVLAPRRGAHAQVVREAGPPRRLPGQHDRGAFRTGGFGLRRCGRRGDDLPPVLVQVRDGTTGRGEAGRDQVEVTVAVEVAPVGTGKEGADEQGGRREGAAVVAQEGRRAGTQGRPAADEQKVGVAVVVVVAPGAGAGQEALQLRVLHFEASVHVPVEEGPAFQDRGGEAGTGQQQVEAAVAVVVRRADRREAQGGQVGARVGERTAVVVQEPCLEAVGPEAGCDEVEAAVAVDVAPGQAAQGQGGQAGVGDGRQGAAVVAEQGRHRCFGGREPGQGQVKVAVVVVVAPGQAATQDRGQAGVGDGRQGAAVVAIEEGGGLVGRFHRAAARDRQVEVAVAVIVGPGPGAVDERLQRGQPGEEDRSVRAGRVRPSVVAVDVGGGGALDEPGEQHVQVTVAVDVAPDGRTVLGMGQRVGDEAERERLGNRLGRHRPVGAGHRQEDEQEEPRPAPGEGGTQTDHAGR